MMSTSRLVYSRSVDIKYKFKKHALPNAHPFEVLYVSSIYPQEVRFFREHNHELDQRVS